MSVWWLLVPASYVLGAFPTAQLIGALTHTDPRRQGSGNPGASNMYRLAGARAGVAVLAGDIGKGLIPTLLGLALDGRELGLAAGLAAVVGHVAPLNHPRGGGKGVATLGGVTIALDPLAAGVLVLIGVIATKRTRVASVGSLLMVSLLPLAALVRGRSRLEVGAFVAVGALVFFRHHANIARLLRGEEQALR